MKFICLDCECIFDEDEISVWQEDRGEFWGVPCGETVSGCPSCGGAYVEAHKCDECDKWITGEYIKTTSGQRICENCYHTVELGDEDY